MTNTEIIDQVKQLTTAERLTVIEAASRLIREDFSERGDQSWDEELALAATALLADYQSDHELMAFTPLEGSER